MTALCPVASVLLHKDHSPEQTLTFLFKHQAIIHKSLIPNIMTLAKTGNTQIKYFQLHPLCSLWGGFL